MKFSKKSYLIVLLIPSFVPCVQFVSAGVQFRVNVNYKPNSLKLNEMTESEQS